MNINGIDENRHIKNALNNVKRTRANRSQEIINIIKYNNFQVINKYMTSIDEKILLSSTLMNNNREIIMESASEIKVYLLSDDNFLITSKEQAMIIETINNENIIISSVTRSKPGEMYKISRFLKDRGLIILSDYSNDEQKNFEYLYDFNTGRRISSGFDSIDEINGQLKVTFGLATGNLDLEGNFIMDAEEEYSQTDNVFTRIFKIFNRN